MIANPHYGSEHLHQIIVASQQNWMMKHNNALVSAYGLRQGTRTAPAAGRAFHMQSTEAFIHRHAFCPHGRYESLTCQSETCGVELKTEFVKSRRAVFQWSIAKRLQTRHVL